MSEPVPMEPLVWAEAQAQGHAVRPRQPQLEVEAILANAGIGIAFTRERRFYLCNARFAELFGWTVEELIGQPGEVVYTSRESYETLGRIAIPLLAGGGQLDVEWELRRRDGTKFPCRIVARAINPEQPAQGTVWLADTARPEPAPAAAQDASDATLAARSAELQAIIDRLQAELAERKLAEERLIAERTAELQATNRRLEAEIAERLQAEGRAQHLADHDVLTGLPNRRLFEDRVTQALAFSVRNRKLTAVMFVDLDRFKHVNDTLGHAVGDAMLKEVAQRLVDQLREGDTICRLGGDEFVILLPEIKRSSDAAHVAQKIIEAVAQPVTLDERDLHITCSIGITVFPDDGRDAEALIRNADAAMYHAKEIGRANYQFFTEQMNIAATRRLALENDLRRSVQNGELRLRCQPVIDLRTGAVAANEALLRWQHPARGLVTPGEFMQLAEDTGLILRLGEWALREACRWAQAQGGEAALPVAVNLSARQFGDPKLVETVQHALRESGLPPHLLELEIGETAIMQYPDVTIPTLHKLKQLGVTLAIDDFGTGHSSFTFLRRFPVDKLKIDVSFVADMAEHKDNEAIIVTIVGLAHALGLKVVAEGVETEAQIEFLRHAHCDYAQGYHIGQPAEAAAPGEPTA
ncbi:MAG: EAL domain-containing protein [Betaproteobacteria bacterium]|nr:MAG: EAL domain-containing protein [Betaproteobacteria bacterium]